ncbi:hypothetical protein EJB05_47311 [Eragrostis curvula]|uniref:F-box domain-containing protein n=1 Tax=Eragrostis curvula TaxID=38414 RepID=A0A5J9T7D9_9POAL|nr:hypothetical protein EJB05_47311 [Eragrostis curvula]
MGNQEQFLFVDAVTAASARRQGMDPRELELETQVVMKYLYTTLPDAPASAAAVLSALPVPDPSGADRLSALPATLLRDIVSRLPTKDAARTAVLSRRWRPVWRDTPLAFADAHLVPGFLDGSRQPTRADTPDLVAVVSRVLVTLHPGPFRAVHLACCYMGAHPSHLARWVQALANKGVQDLVLVNRPWPRDMLLPAAIFAAATLTRLYLGLWKFPDPPVRPRSAAALFPNLRELVLSSMDMENRHLDFILAACPALEKLGIQGIRNEGTRVRLVGHHRLRCVQISASVTESIAVVDAPILERFFITLSMKPDDGSFVRVKIANTPNLRILGHLKPGTHMLEINNTVINAGVKASPSTMVPSVKILGLAVCFGVRNDAKKLPSFLKCFPNVETLHILSEESDEVAGELDLKFWQEAGPIESIQSSIKAMTFRQFRMGQSEISFLKFVFQSAQVLKNARISVSRGCATSPDLVSKVKTLIPDNGPSNSCHVLFCESSTPDGPVVGNFQRGFDFSVPDPFAGEVVLNVP